MREDMSYLLLLLRPPPPPTRLAKCRLPREAWKDGLVGVYPSRDGCKLSERCGHARFQDDLL